MRRFRHLPLITCLLWLPAATYADLSEKIDPLFVAYNKPNVPGAAVGIYQNGEILYLKGYGLADVQGQKKIVPETNFRLASLTKQFTAMSAAILIDDGTLKLEETLTDIFPDFPDYGKSIRIEHLIHHTSGLRDYEDLIPSNQTDPISDEEILELMKRQSGTDFTPGSRYRYSNCGYVILSQVIAKRSGMSFADFVAQRIFQPLWMRKSKVYVRPGLDIENRAYGYTGSGSGFAKTDQSMTSSTQGDGGVYTSVADLFLWDQALNGPVLLTQSMFQRIFSPGKLNDGSEISYGFGWELGSYRGLRCYSHTGSTIGFRTAIQRYPERNFSVAVLINRAGSSPWTIARAIVDRLLF